MMMEAGTEVEIVRWSTIIKKLAITGNIALSGYQLGNVNKLLHEEYNDIVYIAKWQT